MRRAKLIAAVVAASIAASIVPVDADEAIGAIVNIDPVGGTVTLDNGQTFLLSSDVDSASLEIGHYVTVTYEPAESGVNAAVEIKPLSRI